MAPCGNEWLQMLLSASWQRGARQRYSRQSHGLV